MNIPPDLAHDDGSIQGLKGALEHDLETHFGQGERRGVMYPMCWYLQDVKEDTL